MHLLLNENRLLLRLGDDRRGLPISDFDGLPNCLINFQDFLYLSLDLIIGESDLIGGLFELVP